ncbi:MAG: 4'-phosphopantetheinyl transferase [Planctomycetota bacterium]|jgi:4'-phosphopantetheinyl transferase
MQPHLCPVMRATPGQGSHLPAAMRVSNQRRAAREACMDSAERLGLRLDELRQNEDGVPQPQKGWYWSVSHTKGVVCGVVYPAPIGIDVERVQQRRQEIVSATASRAEYDVAGGFRWHNFTRIWSAKEAVLKKAGCGLRELSKCVVVTMPSDRAMVIHHRDSLHYVHQSYQKGHYVSITADIADDAEIRWQWKDNATEELNFDGWGDC